MNSGTDRIHRRQFLYSVLGSSLPLGGLLGNTSRLSAQILNERKVDPTELPLDKPGIWTLHFRYKPIRIANLDIFEPGGRLTQATVWYLWYQVYNMSGEPQFFLPEFELVTRDLNTAHLDEIHPYLVEQINRIENPTGEPRLKVHSSIDISKRPIPPSKPDAVPITVSGVAVWTNIHRQAAGTNRFSVFVTGLSNGLAVEESASGERIIKRKTLQINFVRPTDDKRQRTGDIIPDEAAGPAERWIYRSATVIRKEKKNK
ncbi:MAG: hypothetical protein NZ703_02570 [Gemmataceae bacterium]|nr:hypothetical protein [Gemmataceae bacterium]MCS7269945.1 hypothetical protein [Gemmataceae bacterium]MDW8241777.1 hypothetical protein [Thermogemmata sp.]